jgi:predicted LPLAT superfamily acyltransferase
MLKDYNSAMENMIRMYPLQWYNYYDFWNEGVKPLSAEASAKADKT